MDGWALLRCLIMLLSMSAADMDTVCWWCNWHKSTTNRT